MQRIVLVGLVLVLTEGCMVGPNYRRPIDPAPAAFGELAPAESADVPTARTSHAAQQPIDARWWVTFDDPPLTSLIERALVSNLDVKQAEARVLQSRASRRVSGSALWPSVGASGSAIRDRESKRGINGSEAGDRETNLFTIGFDANWEIDVFGGIRRSLESADATVEATEADRDAVLVTLFGDIGFEYVTYRSLQERIALANENLHTQQATLDLTRRLYTAGLASELDLSRAAAQVATTASTIPGFEEQAAQSVHRLGVLLGQPPMALQGELAPQGAIPQAPAVVSVGLPSELLLRRPDVARSERALAAATADIGVATADLFPRFFITGAAALQSIHATDLFDWGSRLASIGPSITWPVFEGGAIRANIALRDARQQELLAAYQAAVLRAFEDVENALVAFARDQDTRAQLEEAVRADARATELSQRLYAQGLTDFLNVLVAQQTLFVAQDALAQSRRDVALDLVALYKAVGGGWETAPAP